MVAEKVFSKSLSNRKSHTAHFGTIQDGQRIIDEVIAVVFKGPNSFTGEDTIEFNCHGSIYVQQEVVNLLIRSGARMAQPGEFSMRSYLNGKMDLSQAEAVGDLIAAESEAAHVQAVHQMRGGFSKEINSLRDRLIHFASMVELELDFGEEDVEFANRPQLLALVVEIQGVVERLRDSFSLGNSIKNGIAVAILGSPNMGKSTLLNALLNEERAIVSDIAGTTRDTVEDALVLEGLRFRFIDTAGIRTTEDTIEKLGIERSFAKAKEAAVLLLLFDAIETSREELQSFIQEVKESAGEKTPILLLANKIDKEGFDSVRLKKTTEGLGTVISISAKGKTHIEELKSRLVQLVDVGRVKSGETIVTNARHYEALVRASQSLADIETGLNNGITGDFLAVDIRKTLYHLGEITGQINADDLLNSIFSRFCIGK